MPRFVTDSRPISALHPITEFYRQEFARHHRCLQQQRAYFSESAITDVEAALSRIMNELEQLCSRDNAGELVSSLLKQIDGVTGLSASSDSRQSH
ncbi:MAG: hypothetical protein AB7Q29_05885 [Vicinamibacterales bacterium]